MNIIKSCLLLLLMQVYTSNYAQIVIKDENTRMFVSSDTLEIQYFRIFRKALKSGTITQTTIIFPKANNSRESYVGTMFDPETKERLEERSPIQLINYCYSKGWELVNSHGFGAEMIMKRISNTQ